MESYNTILAFLIVALIIGFADLLSQKTKGYLSVLFTATLIFIILFVSGYNKKLFEIASITKPAGCIAVSFIITHLGTTLNLKTIKGQWRTVLLASTVMAGLVCVFFLLIPLIFDKNMAIAASAVGGGGIVAIFITQEVFNAHNLGYLSVFMVLFLSLKCLIGYPLASILLRFESKRLLAERHSEKNKQMHVLSENSASWPFKPFLIFTRKHNSFDILIAKIALVTFIAYAASRITNFGINPYLLCFIFGYLAKEVAFLEPEILKKANSFGFLMLVNLAVIFSVLTMADYNSLLTLWFPLLIVMLIALSVIVVVSFFTGRALGFSTYMSIAAGIACMFGFPGTFVIPGEVAKSVTKNQDEHDYVFNRIFPVMLISGFVNITVLSVIIAGILVKFI